MRGGPGAQGFEPEHHLALVVHGAARDDARAERVIDEARLEGRAGPQVERLRGLHVVVPVVEQVRRVRAFGWSGVMGEHDRVARRLDGFHAEADLPELLAEPGGGPAAILRVRRLRADARDAQPLEPPGHGPVAVGREMVEDGFERVGHSWH